MGYVEIKIPITLTEHVIIRSTSPLDDAGWQRLVDSLDFIKPGLYQPAPIVEETDPRCPICAERPSAAGPETPCGACLGGN